MEARTWKNPVIGWIDRRLPIFSMMQADLVDYPTPKNLNYWWNFGSLAGIVLVVMIGTGIFLAMHYTPHVDHAFESVERIMRDVNYGWLMRYLHMNGASMFFIVVYIHMFRGLYYGSYKNPRELLWIIGVFIIIAMMATAFMGYVLPWGQMSFWGATVITNLFSAIPLVGEAIVTWLWGGFTVDNATLNRFYSLHYLMPFVIFALVFLHLVALHTTKSNNPLGIDVKGPQDTIPFTPYYTIKDMFGLGVFLLIYLGFVFFAPNFFGEPDNYIKANPLVTPPHIVPEWYFLPFYAILRAITFDIWFIPAKLIGVVAMFGSILILLIPALARSVAGAQRHVPAALQAVLLDFRDRLLRPRLRRRQPPGGLLRHLGQVATAYYFAHFLIIIPLLNFLERPRPLPASISAAVTPAGVGIPARESQNEEDAVRGHRRRRLGARRRTGAEVTQAPSEQWSFSGLFGTSTERSFSAAIRCTRRSVNSCHGLKFIAFRNLQDLGFTPDQVQAIAAEFEVQDGPNDEGDMFMRPARAADRVPSPFPNDQAARVANNGALPPDLSLIVEARKGGADYIYACSSATAIRRRRASSSAKGCTTTSTFQGIRSPCRRRSPTDL